MSQTEYVITINCESYINIIYIKVFIIYMETKAYPQLKAIIEWYGKFLPINSFVMVMLSLA